MTDKTQATAHACIKPQCDPAKCSDCACAITPSDGAGQVVLGLLNAFAVNDLGHPFEDGDRAAVDRARQWLQNRSPALQAASPAPAAVPVLYVSPAQLEKHLDLEGAENAEAGRYLPARKTPAGQFTQPLYAIAAAPAQEHATQLAGQAPAAPVAHPHHCTARSADGACEECEGHAQAMAEWRAEAAAPAQAQEDALAGWEGISSLPNCDDLIWLYCQDTNTVDGPVVPSPSYVDSWTHWAFAEAPSTTAIDAARAAQGGA